MKIFWSSFTLTIINLEWEWRVNYLRLLGSSQKTKRGYKVGKGVYLTLIDSGEGRSRIGVIS